MALNYPDILQHNNSNYALLDASQLRGNAYVINSLSATGSVPSDKRNPGSIIFATGSQQFYGFYGTSSADWNITTNWKLLSSGGGGTVFSGTTGVSTSSTLFTVDPATYRTIYVNYNLQYDKDTLGRPSRTGQIQVTIPFQYTTEQIYYTEQTTSTNSSLHDKTEYSINTEQAVISFSYDGGTQLINAVLTNNNPSYTVSIKGEWKL